MTRLSPAIGKNPGRIGRLLELVFSKRSAAPRTLSCTHSAVFRNGRLGCQSKTYQGKSKGRVSFDGSGTNMEADIDGSRIGTPPMPWAVRLGSPRKTGT